LALERSWPQLVQHMAEVVTEANRGTRPARLLNVGAGKDAWIERRIAGLARDFVVDRVDVVNPAVDYEHVGDCWQCSVEAMEPVPSAYYDGAFANYVLEHVGDVAAAADELFRVLRVGGLFAATFSNSKAPEMRLAKHTPTWFHALFTGKGHSCDTHYSYGSVADLVGIFEASGWRTIELAYEPVAHWYLSQLGVPLLPTLGSAYDALLDRLQWSGGMGHVFAYFAKP